MSLTLFRRWPGLEKQLAIEPLTELPSPLQNADALARELNVGRLWIKRDDICALEYGGNKVRKLEFLLADARRQRADGVLTFGAAGSNHALATSIYARRLGLRCAVILTPQAHTPWVESTLLKHLELGTELHSASDGSELKSKMDVLRKSAAGRELYVIPFGGSSWLGTLGFVSAGLELAEQLTKLDIPAPDFLYAACGTMGTVAGLALGLGAAGLATKIVSVRVTPEIVANRMGCARLYSETLKRVREHIPDFPGHYDPMEVIQWRDNQYGIDYAVPTEAAISAMTTARDSAGLELETTYTSKAFAALISDAQSGRLRGRSALFWNTFNSRSWPNELDPMSRKQLPGALQTYFDNGV